MSTFEILRKVLDDESVFLKMLFQIFKYYLEIMKVLKMNVIVADCNKSNGD